MNVNQTEEKANLVQFSFSPEIQGLRAIAVCAVIINHINKDWLPSGYLGVDVFFCYFRLCNSKKYFTI